MRINPLLFFRLLEDFVWQYTFIPDSNGKSTAAMIVSD